MKTDAHVTVRVSRVYGAPPERVFDAFLAPKQAAKFLFATPQGKMVRAEVDARVGGKFVFADRRENEDIEHIGEYEQIVRPRRLAFTFTVPKFSSEATRVTVEIKPRGEGCDVTLTHEGVLAEYGERTQQGWAAILDQLAATIGDQGTPIIAASSVAR